MQCHLKKKKGPFTSIISVEKWHRTNRQKKERNKEKWQNWPLEMCLIHQTELSNHQAYSQMLFRLMYYHIWIDAIRFALDGPSKFIYNSPLFAECYWPVSVYKGPRQRSMIFYWCENVFGLATGICQYLVDNRF